MNTVLKRETPTPAIRKPQVKSVSLRALSVAARLERHAGHDHDRIPRPRKSN